MTLPSRITEEARKREAMLLLASLSADSEPDSQTDIEKIEAAFLAAEQRGREMEREGATQDCFARAHKHHRQAKEYEAQGDEDSQAICLTCAVEAMDIAAAIRSTN